MPKAKTKTDESDAVAVLGDPVDLVAESAAKLDAARAVLADAQAAHDAVADEHAAVVARAKPKIGRFDPKKPTLIMEGSDGETPMPVGTFSDEKQGHDYRVGDLVHCANLDLEDDDGPYQRWVYRKL